MSVSCASEIAVILLNETGNIVDAHDSCAETFGWSREELIGKDIGQLLQFGRDLLMSQLQMLEVDSSAGNTSFSIRILARRKNCRQFPARATIRRFQELDCWTAAFYRVDSETAESNLPPTVSPEEIALAKRALESSGERKDKQNSSAKEPINPSDSIGARPWRNSRLLFNTREEQSQDKVLGSIHALRDDIDSSTFDTAFLKKGPQSLERPGREQNLSIESLADSRVTLPAPSPSFVPTFNDEPALNFQVQALKRQLSDSLDAQQKNHLHMAALEQAVQETNEALIASRDELANERHERRSAEEHNEILTALNAHMEENLLQAEKARASLEDSFRDQSAQIENNHELLKKSAQSLAREREARQRLELTVSSLQCELHALEQNTANRVAHFKSSLELADFEQSRTEEYLLRTKAELFKNARTGRARMNEIQGNLARLLKGINGATSELLRSPLTEEQKFVIECLLQETVALEGTLESIPLSLSPLESLPVLTSECAAANECAA